jgi:hypothetical protein
MLHTHISCLTWSLLSLALPHLPSAESSAIRPTFQEVLHVIYEGSELKGR